MMKEAYVDTCACQVSSYGRFSLRNCESNILTVGFLRPLQIAALNLTIS